MAITLTKLNKEKHSKDDMYNDDDQIVKIVMMK